MILAANLPRPKVPVTSIRRSPITRLKTIQLNDQFTNANNYKTVRDMKKIITDSFSGGLITSCSEIKILGWSCPLSIKKCRSINYDQNTNKNNNKMK